MRKNSSNTGGTETTSSLEIRMDNFETQTGSALSQSSFDNGDNMPDLIGDESSLSPDDPRLEALMLGVGFIVGRRL